ncbi:hypothetical protein AALB53_08445 [Lachnospiraceae bacterium 47-T17]
MKKEKIIVLLDDNSKAIIKTNVSAMLSNGVIFITSLLEITGALLKETNKVVVLEGFLELNRSISDLLLYKQVLNLQYFYLGSSARWFSIMKDYATCFKCDIALLDFSIIQAALYQDKSLESDSNVNNFSDCIEIAQSVLKNSAKEDDRIVKLSNGLLAVLEREKMLKTTLQEKLDLLKYQSNEYAQMCKLKDTVLEDYRDVIKSSVALNKSLQQYEISMTRNIYRKFNLHVYNNRPSILYFKEYEELPQLDLLIETLTSIFRLQEQKSVKVLRLYDNSGNRKVDVLPEYYKVIFNRYYSKDILASDYICKTGDYSKVVDTLLTNRINVDVLIIIDCKDHNDIILDGLSLQFCLCRDEIHAKKWGLLPENTILGGDTSVDEKEQIDSDYLRWGPYSIDNFNKEEEFAFLSSRATIMKLLKIYRYFEQSV